MSGLKHALTLAAFFQLFGPCLLLGAPPDDWVVPPEPEPVAPQGVAIVPSGVLYQIAVTGPIDRHTVEDFTKAVVDPRIINTKGFAPNLVSLNSLGGSVTDALTIGEMVRRAGLMTGVFVGAECSSACVLILAAGVLRIATGRIGLHRPRFDDESSFALLTQEEARAKYTGMADGIRQYLKRMGMSDDLYVAMLRVPSDQIMYLSETSAREFGLDGEDPSWVEHQRAVAIARSGRKSYEAAMSLGRVTAACWNALGPDRCTRDVSQYKSEIEHCSSEIEAEYIGCVRAVERRAITKYR